MDNRMLLGGLISILLSMCFYCCTPNNDISISTDPHKNLSDYHFFVGNISDLHPNERVLPYDLNSPLFSDYSHKSRFIWMPEGVGATPTVNKVLSFPLGTAIIKTFYYQHDERDVSKGRRLIETRLLIKEADQWAAHSYIWNEEQTDAHLEVVGDIKEVSWVNTSGKDMKLDYIIPNKNQCKGCHYNKGVVEPIGPKLRNLNKSFAYSDTTMNQLERWANMGYLDGYDATQPQPVLANYADANSGTLHERAMAYLDINCGHCHNPNGPANTTGLNLIAEAKYDLNLGIWKAPVAAGGGTGGFSYNIVPGHPEESILPYRMAATEPGTMMPELGRRMIHQEGVALIEDWIRNMESEEELRIEN